MPLFNSDPLCPHVSIGKNGINYRLVISTKIFADKRQRFIALGTTDLLYAKSKQIELQSDINSDNFDPTLAKYKAWRLDSTPRYDVSEALTLGKLWLIWCEYRKPMIAESTYIQKFNGTFARAIDAIGNDRAINGENATYARNWLLSNRNRLDAAWLLRELETATNRAINDGLHKGNNPFWGMGKELSKMRNRKINTKDIDTALADLEDRRSYTQTDRNNIIDYFQEKYPIYYPFVFFRFYTGCRFGESIELRWGDLTEDCRVILFRRSYWEDGDVIKATKTGDERRFNCSERLTQLFLSLKPSVRHEETLVFTNTKGTRIKLSNFKRYWHLTNDALYDVGKLSVKLSPKHTRHTFVNLALDAGISQDAITRQVGHSARVEETHYRDYSTLNELIIDF